MRTRERLRDLATAVSGQAELVRLTAARADELFGKDFGLGGCEKGLRLALADIQDLLEIYESMDERGEDGGDCGHGV